MEDLIGWLQGWGQGSWRATSLQLLSWMQASALEWWMGSSTGGSVMSHSQSWQLESVKVWGAKERGELHHACIYIHIHVFIYRYMCLLWKDKKCGIARLCFPKSILFPSGLKERGQQTRLVFFSRLWACPLWLQLQGGGWWLPVCQRPTSLVHFDIHMGAVMILKAAIKLTAAFRGSAWCRHWAAPIIPSGNTP